MWVVSSILARSASDSARSKFSSNSLIRRFRADTAVTSSELSVEPDGAETTRVSDVRDAWELVGVENEPFLGTMAFGRGVHVWRIRSRYVRVGSSAGLHFATATA